MNPNGVWQTCRLSEIAPACSSEMPKSVETVWNLSLEDIQAGTGKILTKNYCKVSELGSTKCAFDCRHVLYSKLRPYLNKVALPDKPGVGTSELIPLQPNSNRLCREFLAFYLRSPIFKEFAILNTRGANLPRVSMSDFWSYEIPLPPLDEQRRIVSRIKECLSRVEEIERLRQESGRATEALLPSILNLEFQELLQSYESRSIGDIAIETRYGTSHKCTAEITEIPVLRIPNIASGIIKFDDLKYCQLDSKELERLILKPGDLLFVRRNGSRELVGRCAIFENTTAQKYAFASYLIRVRLDYGRIRPHFLSYFLNSSLGRIELNKRRRTSAGQFNINSENLRSIPVPVPSVDIQDQIIRRLNSKRDALLELRFDIKQSNSDSTALRESILRKAFAGEL